MAANIAVVYDACVLYPAPLRDLLIIVTFNLKDFPDPILAKYGIVAQHPDVFVGDLIELYPQQVLQAVDTILARLKNPPQTFDNHLETLANQGLLTSVAMLRDLRSES